MSSTKLSPREDYMSSKQLMLCTYSEVEEETEIESTGTKICVYCETEKDLSEFPKHIGHKDNLDTRCKECIKEQSKIRSDLYKSAPPRPEFCECCGEVPKKHMTLDHDHETNKFRGWICDRCNVGIGLLGDDITGVTNAMNYLLSRDL